MAKSFNDLREKMSPDAVKKSARLTKTLSNDIRLSELRTALGLSQKELADLLKRKQAAISRLERRSDIHISTLREFVAALGGRLELIASFPDGSYHIKQFEQD